MAYQNVGTPRFYIDYLSYFSSIGAIKQIWMHPQYSNLIEGDFIGLDPTSVMKLGSLQVGESIGAMDIAIEFHEQIPVDFMNTLNYTGIIGHNFSEESQEGFKLGLRPYTCWKHPDEDFPLIGGGSLNEFVGDFSINNLIDIADGVIVNTSYHDFPGHDDTISFPNNGFSLFKCKYEEYPAEEGHENPHAIGLGLKCFNYDTGVNFWDDFSGIWNMNCFILGSYYDMPHSPELNISMEIGYEGVKSITTRGGAHLSNVNYNGSPNWESQKAMIDDLGSLTSKRDEMIPWIVGESSNKAKRLGRRIWDLSFSYLSDQDLFSSNYMSNDYLETSGTNTDYDDNDDLTEDNNNFYYKFFEDDSFHARVLNFIGGGKRFVFQPDNTNNNPDQFAICVLDQKSLEIEQVANGVYNISMTIKEVW